MAPVNLFDTLEFQDASAPNVSLRCRWSHGFSGANQRSSPPQGEANLAHRAVTMLRAAAGVDRGAQLQIIKRIPAAAGLGGASSNAAMALLAANEIWQLGWSMAQLAELAAELGSDVPLFIYSRPAIASGRGERLAFTTLPKLHFVLVKPREGLSTPEVYRQVQLQDCGRAACSATEIASLLRNGRWRQALGGMVNDLERPARKLSSTIDATFHRISAQGLRPFMSGSGSSCFALANSAGHARAVARRLATDGCETFSIETHRDITFPSAN